MLRNQLDRSQPDQIPELHRRASRWYEGNGDIEAAIDHALQDTDLTRAARLIEQNPLPKVYHGEVTRVVGWFDRLPEAIMESAAMLCIHKAWALVLMRRGTRRGEVGLALKAAERALHRVNAGEALRNLVAGHAASILLEYDHRAEVEQLLTEGLDLVRWTADSIAPKFGYTVLARLRSIQGDWPAMLEAVKTLEETWPEGALYPQTLRHRLLLRHRPDDPDVQKVAHTWLAQSRIEFEELAVIDSADPISTTYFECYLNAAHVLARLAKERPGVYPVEDAQAYLKRQQKFAASYGFVSWAVEIAIARVLLYEAVGKKHEAVETLERALGAAGRTGLFRLFVDEGEILKALLEDLKPRLTDETLTVYANRLVEAWSSRLAKPESGEEHEALLSKRELDVLHCLSKGLTYQEIGQPLFLSLNTVQFHVKNIYGKLLVNKRAQAIEKAREMNLI